MQGDTTDLNFRVEAARGTPNRVSLDNLGDWLIDIEGNDIMHVMVNYAGTDQMSADRTHLAQTLNFASAPSPSSARTSYLPNF